ncbi:MAG: hypothetical protein ACI8PG_004521, partial [Planctomycetota bacterium]
VDLVLRHFYQRLKKCLRSNHFLAVDKQLSTCDSYVNASALGALIHGQCFVDWGRS